LNLALRRSVPARGSTQAEASTATTSSIFTAMSCASSAIPTQLRPSRPRCVRLAPSPRPAVDAAANLVEAGAHPEHFSTDRARSSNPSSARREASRCVVVTRAASRGCSRDRSRPGLRAIIPPHQVYLTPSPASREDVAKHGRAEGEAGRLASRARPPATSPHAAALRAGRRAAQKRLPVVPGVSTPGLGPRAGTTTPPPSP